MTVLIALTILYFCYVFRFAFYTSHTTVHLSSTGEPEDQTSEVAFKPIHNPARSHIAAITKNRSPDNPAPLILHFSTVLGPNWPVVLFTSESNKIPPSA